MLHQGGVSCGYVQQRKQETTVKAFYYVNKIRTKM
jgi:hypothetical protein